MLRSTKQYQNIRRFKSLRNKLNQDNEEHWTNSIFASFSLCVQINLCWFEWGRDVQNAKGHTQKKVNIKSSVEITYWSSQAIWRIDTKVSNTGKTMTLFFSFFYTASFQHMWVSNINSSKSCFNGKNFYSTSITSSLKVKFPQLLPS